MKSITLYVSCFLYIILCTLSMADVVSRHYTVDPSLDNKVSNNSLVTKHHSESLIECGIKCGELCTFFGFNLQLKKCHIHQSCDSSELTATEAGWMYFKPDADSPTADLGLDCWELLKKGHTKSGVYQINPTGKSNETISVYCDMETSCGGWTVIQKREDNSTDFYRDWTDYKKGFGDPSKNYWIGNDVIHALTKNNQELRVHLESFDNQSAYAEYSSFRIENESDKYRLTVGGYSGTAGNGLGDHNGYNFSTRDQDNEVNSRNCAVWYHGAWWYFGYRICGSSNLNGQYVGSAMYDYQYPVWYYWKNKFEALKRTQIMIRPK